MTRSSHRPPSVRPFESIQFKALAPGVRLIVTGAVHGNETCGTTALRRLAQEIRDGTLELTAGELSLVPVTNPLAYARRQREGERNLNRGLCPTDSPRHFEDHVANWLCPLLARHEVLLDLHSFRSPGVPFALVGPLDNEGPLEPFRQAEREARWAVRLGVGRLVDGWLATFAQGAQRRRTASVAGRLAHPDYGVGTTEYMRRTGGCALTLECGQHDDPNAPEIAYQAVRRTLAHFGLVDAPDPLPGGPIQGLRLVEVMDKTHPDDAFERAWTSFDPVRAGERIGTRQNGVPVQASFDGCIVFPNPGAGAGEEWFYLARPSDRFGAAVAP